MWQITNRTPFAAERGWARDREGAEVWLVAVKATFDLSTGVPRIAAEQPPVLRLPQHHGDPGSSSVMYDADLVLAKRTTDVIVLGHAYAPSGTSAAQVDVDVRVGPVKKVIRVFGDRTWGALGPSVPRPFVKMPLTYEHAFGGVDARSATPEAHWEWRNPVGTGYAISSRNARGLKLPNLEDPGALIRCWDDRPQPAGLGPIACHWQPRVAFAGTYDDHWMQTRQPLWAEDLDDRYFQCAPADQQAPDFLHGGESVVLQGMTPGGRLDFALPRLHLGFDTRFVDGSRELHRNRKLHTVILEPDHPRVSLVWHSALPCHFKVHQLERTIVTVKTAPALRGCRPIDSELSAEDA
jgi:hypothetical protein